MKEVECMNTSAVRDKSYSNKSVIPFPLFEDVN